MTNTVLEQHATPTVRLGTLGIAALTLRASVDAVFTRVGDAQHHLVVTPNVDHMVLLSRDAEFAAAYERASLRLVDGAPLVALARLCRSPLPERVTGVDLTLAVLDAAEARGASVFFLGGRPDVLDTAMSEVRRRWPRLVLAGWASPMVDLESVGPDEEQALADVRAARPDVLVLCLGAPKQEKWYWRRRDDLPPCVALAVGGTVEILAGTRLRAPVWAQARGLEWLWRLAQDPRRLASRYLVRDLEFVRIAAATLWSAHWATRAETRSDMRGPMRGRMRGVSRGRT